ncbi:probable RNA-binding protein 18 [Culicoides brevitarsis]|uniref:probable RNA-binding protein 18 n=1 Tax=Culicoides brevitarsis TaxID=469753 RepID=UPI00307B2C32
MSSDETDKRLWIGNLDPRITEYKLIKILQKCGEIEKFDLLFYRNGPQAGQPRGYGFVSFKKPEDHEKAIQKLNGIKIGDKHIAVRPANKVNYDELEKPKPKIDIPALTAGTSASSSSMPATHHRTKTVMTSKELAIQALEAKLKQLEDSNYDFELNKTAANEAPLIQKYQYNKDKPSQTHTRTKYSHNRHRSRPYGKSGRR